MATDSNVDLALITKTANTGAIPNNIEPAIPVAVALVPKGTIIPATAFVSQAAFLTYITDTTQGFLADTQNSRWLLLNNLDTFVDATKKMAEVDTGRQQWGTIKFDTKFNFRYLTNKANHQEAMALDNAQGDYDVYIWDAATNIWGQQDPTGAGGMGCLYLAQIRIMDWMPYTTKDMNVYDISIQLKGRAQLNENFAIYTTGVDSDAIKGLMNAVLTDVSDVLGTPLIITTTTDIVCILKAGQNSIDLASPQFYQGVLTKGCFVAKNLTLSTTLAISTLNQGTIVVGGQVYNYLWFILSAAPASGNVVQITLAAPSVVDGIIPDFNAVTEIVQFGINGANAAVHTFA